MTRWIIHYINYKLFVHPDLPPGYFPAGASVQRYVRAAALSWLARQSHVSVMLCCNHYPPYSVWVSALPSNSSFTPWPASRWTETCWFVSSNEGPSPETLCRNAKLLRRFGVISQFTRSPYLQLWSFHKSNLRCAKLLRRFGVISQLTRSPHLQLWSFHKSNLRRYHQRRAVLVRLGSELEPRHGEEFLVPPSRPLPVEHVCLFDHLRGFLTAAFKWILELHEAFAGVSEFLSANRQVQALETRHS